MSSDDDDECFAVQLDGSGMYPRAQKVAIYSPLVSMLVLTSILSRQFSGRDFR
jgi:hypothetical protein